jgi:alpha-galactosidase
LAIEVSFDPFRLRCGAIKLGEVEPVIDGAVATHSGPDWDQHRITWTLEAGKAVLEIEQGEELRLRFRLEGVPGGRAIDSLGLRFGTVEGVGRYLRNGYHSWDGSFFADPGTPAGEGPPAKAPTLGFAMTALLPEKDEGALVIGFTRHDRFQTRFKYGGSAAQPWFTLETLRDRAPHEGIAEAEPIVLFDDPEVEPALRRWSHIVAAEATPAPRLLAQRITGWCSWYNLYAAIDEASILDHLAAAASFRDEHRVPLGVFQIDDGFTPEMGDWLEVKPQFPRGMKPLIEDIAVAGFTPGLWIAPFLVGNRSRLFAEHPDWVVQSRHGGPLVHMKFYGEFRWHKRSEEYHVLDVTHPQAADYIRTILRIWRHEWGVRYFKTDFMNAGMEYGPHEALWHESGLSRVEIWRRMAAIIREEIGDALWLGCGCPLWASVGLVDAVRIGRDIGVAWEGEYSAESLLRDQLTRNHASHILWQADPDCILLRKNFHSLSEEEVKSLALFAGLSGGVLMTSDKLDDLPEERARLFEHLLTLPVARCSFPKLGATTGVIEQVVELADGSFRNFFNVNDRKASVSGLGEVSPHASLLIGDAAPN